MVLRLTPDQYRKMTGAAAPTARRAVRKPVAVPTGGVWPRIVHDDESVVFWYPAPGRAPTANDGGHWSKRSGPIADWRSTAAMFARRVPFERDTPTIVTVIAPSGVRDAANLAVPCGKAVIDGLCDAGYWPDDNTAMVYAAQPIPLPRSIPLAGVALTPVSAGVERALVVASRAAQRLVTASKAA